MLSQQYVQVFSNIFLRKILAYKLGREILRKLQQIDKK